MKHPPQREMWEGLTPFGCLAFVAMLIIIDFLVNIASIAEKL